jgi:hypothetical protein
MNHAVRTSSTSGAARPRPQAQPRRGRRLARVAAASLALGAGLALLLDYARGAPPRARHHARPLEREIVDLAASCLGAGAVQPPVGELTDAELGALVEILGRLIGAYARRDFDSYLALRAGDLEHAERVQSERRDELRGLCIELGRRSETLPLGWRALLGAYWEAYYRAEAPVARFRPESTVLVLHRERPSAPLAEWEAEFEALVVQHPGARVRHRMMMPHGRPLEDVAGDPPTLTWVDLQLAYDAHDGAAGWLIARFVWDARMEEWFLHRATTVLDGELRDDRRHLVL